MTNYRLMDVGTDMHTDIQTDPNFIASENIVTTASAMSGYLV